MVLPACLEGGMAGGTCDSRRGQGNAPSPSQQCCQTSYELSACPAAQAGELAPCSQALVWLSHSQWQAKDFST